jgi:phosphoglycerate dehydrogenase-like enzyme
MLIAGLGGIGTEVGRRAHGLGMRIVATRASHRPAPDFVSQVGSPAELITLVRTADVIVDTLPLTDETRGIFDAKMFAAMKPRALFINVGRGGTVVTDELLRALNEKRLGGAGLDVTDPEPLPPAHPLWRAPNVIITPHVSSDSDIGSERHWLIARENLRRYVAGDRMLSVVDVKRGY